MALLEAEKSWQFDEADQMQAAANLALVNESVSSFIEEHGAVTDINQRIDMVLGLSAGLRSTVEQNDVVQNYPEAIKASTQLDILEWEALKALWFLNTPVMAGVKLPPGHKALRSDEFSARERVLDDISTIHRMNFGNELQAHDELANQYWAARLAVKNPPSPVSRTNIMDRAILAQHLNIHKTVNGLRSSGFQNARRANLGEKEDQLDVVVPLGQHKTRSVSIRFQPGSRGAGELSAYGVNKVLLVNVPYEARENPFVMNPKDKKALASGVNDMRRQLFAAGGGVILKAAA